MRAAGSTVERAVEVVAGFVAEVVGLAVVPDGVAVRAVGCFVVGCEADVEVGFTGPLLSFTSAINSP